MSDLSVLIVDDERLLRENLALLLESLERCRTYQAQNGYEALDILHKYPIDLVLLDVNMPGLGGIELLKVIRQKFDIPVILMTGYPSIELSVEALRSGASDFLIKPFTAQQLEQVIQKVKLRKQVSQDREYQRMLDLLKQKTREQTLLFTVSDRLTSTSNLQELYGEVLNLALEFTRSPEGVFFLVDPQGDRLVPEVWSGTEEPPEELSREHDDPVSKSAREGLPVILAGERALLAAPFFIKEELLGVLRLRREENFSEEDLFAVNLILERAAPLAENFILYESIILNLHDALRALVKTLEAKDPYTKEHSERVTRFALMIGRHMGLSAEDLDTLQIAGHLHDLGKVGIRDAILLKPGRLTPEEYEVIKQHPVIGAEIVGHIGMLSREAEIIKCHHERWDGRGYPQGLRGEEIPLLARILAVADAFDAMTSTRPYRPPLTPEEALREIARCAGEQFDPEAARAFEEVWRQEGEERCEEGDERDRSRSAA